MDKDLIKYNSMIDLKRDFVFKDSIVKIEKTMFLGIKRKLRKV